MDLTAIATAVIVAAGSLGGSLAGIRQSNKVVNLRLDNLEKKMDKHNNFMERLSIVEVKYDELDKRLHELHSVDDDRR